MSSDVETTTNANHETVAPATREEIPISQIRISPLNPRHGVKPDVDTLVDDIRANNGVLQPILMRKTDGGGYEIVAGSRRFHALTIMRGQDEGALHSDEYRIVEMSDDQAIRAAVSENKERQDVSPAAEGQYLNKLAKTLGQDGTKITDEVLETKTGLDRPRINSMRALADCIGFLPESWQKGFNEPPNRSPGDNSLTATHFKHVRKRVAGVSKITAETMALLEKTVEEGWSAKELKKKVKALDGHAENSQEATERVRDQEAEPDYSKVLKSLKTARVHTGSDDELAALIEPIIAKVESTIEAQKAEAEAKDKDNAVEKAG